MSFRITIIAAAMSCFALLGHNAHAADILGTWQAMAPAQRVVKITKTTGNLYSGEVYYPRDLEGTLNGNPIARITEKHGVVHFQMARRYGVFDGKLSADGKTIAGIWRGTYSTRSITLARATVQNAWPVDPSPHKTHIVTVSSGVNLEVLDWGGSGPPLLFLGGLGSSAHDFDDIAPKFTKSHRVYAITRRGFGISSAPPPTVENYNPDRLADDVLSVMAKLGIKSPVLAGHSIAGQEMASIATRRPTSIAGLIHIESAYSYTYLYASPETDAARWAALDVVIPVLRQYLDRLPKAGPVEAKQLIAEIQRLTPRLQSGLKNYVIWPQPPVRMPQDLIRDVIIGSAKSYPGNSVPTLAIFAIPQKCAVNCNTSAQNNAVRAHIRAFAKANLNAKIVQFAHATHDIHRTQEVDVIREMKKFMKSQ